MDLLFDTHSFIWWANEPKKLSETALAALEDESNRLFLSDVSIWEMQIKVQLGKMKLKLSIADLINSQQRDNAVEILQIITKHILALNSLPLHHKDPFDRLLIAQSKVESLTIVTLNPKFPAYGTKLLCNLISGSPGHAISALLVLDHSCAPVNRGVSSRGGKK